MNAMQKPVLKIISQPQSPSRAALASAIEKYSAAVAYLARLEAAHERASELVYDAVAKAELADAALSEAKLTEDADLARAFIAGEAAPSRTKTATIAAEDAHTRLDAARRTRDATEAAIKQADAELQWAESRRDDALRETLSVDPAVRQLAADFITAFRTYVDLRRKMEFVSPLADLLDWRGEANWPDLPGATPWQAAIEALKRDADATLPT